MSAILSFNSAIMDVANAVGHDQSAGRTPFGFFDCPWRPEGGFPVERMSEEHLLNTWKSLHENGMDANDIRKYLLRAHYFHYKAEWEAQSHSIPCDFIPKDSTVNPKPILPGCTDQSQASSISKDTFLKEHKVAIILVTAAVLTIAAIVLTYYILEATKPKDIILDNKNVHATSPDPLLQPLTPQTSSQPEHQEQHSPDQSTPTENSTDPLKAKEIKKTEKEQLPSLNEKKEMDAFDLVHNLVFLRTEKEIDNSDVDNPDSEIAEFYIDDDHQYESAKSVARAKPSSNPFASSFDPSKVTFYTETPQMDTFSSVEGMLWDQWTLQTTYVPEASGAPSTTKAFDGAQFVVDPSGLIRHR